MPPQEQLHPFSDPTHQARSDIVVEARGLCRTYGSGQAQVVALDNVNLAVRRGEFVAIMGPSGSGKSTLLHCLAGLDVPDGGQSRIAGRDITGMNDDDLTLMRRDMLGFIFQSFNLLPSLSAEENILLPLRLARRSPDKGWYDAIIAALGIGNRLTHRPSELSGGQQQRVAVARALMSRPTVIVADEPTGNLDSHSSAEVLDLLRRAVDELDQSVIMVTHDTGAAEHADRVLVCRDGRIVADLRGADQDALAAALR